MSKEEFMAKLQMVYVGDKNAFNELIYAYSNLEQKNIELNNINDKLSNALNSAEQRIDKAIEYIKKAYEEDEDNKIPLEDLCLKNCTYNPSLVALSILKDEGVKDNV